MTSALRLVPGNADSARPLLRRLLVAFKDSAAGRAALATGEELARRDHACLVVTLVLNRPWFAGLTPALTVMPAAGEVEELPVGAFRAAIDALGRDLSITTVICHGRVGPALVHVAADQGCDAIAIGAGAKRWRPSSGRVERYLRRHATVPVLVARSTDPGERWRATHPALLRADRGTAARVGGAATNSNLAEPWR